MRHYNPGPPYPPPPPHAHAQFIKAEETERELADIGARLQKIGQALADRGEVTLDSVTVKPIDPCTYIIRYERMPAGELSLKMELVWWENEAHAVQAKQTEIEIS